MSFQTISIAIISLLPLIYITWKLVAHYLFWWRQGIKVRQYLDFDGYLIRLRDRVAQDLYAMGKVYGGYRLNKKVLAIADPKLVKELFALHSNKLDMFLDYYRGTSIMNSILAFMPRKVWSRVRPIMSHSMSVSNTKNLFDRVDAVCQQLVKKLMKTAGQTIEIDKVTRKYLLKAIISIMFGVVVEENSDIYDKIIDSVERINQPKISVKLFVAVFLPKLASLLKIETFDVQAVNTIESIVDSFLSAKINAKTNEIATGKDFFQIVIDNNFSNSNNEKEKISYEELKGQAINIFIAGLDTVNSAITHALYHLSQNPKIQVKLHQELNELDTFDYNSLSNLKYLNAVIDETLRLCPPIITAGHRVTHDICLTNKDVFVPKDSTIDIMIYAMHRDPDYWKEPLVFNPDRFMNKDYDSAAFMPFLGGPRICLGKLLAYMQMRLFLAHMAKNFVFDLHRGFEIEYLDNSLELKPKNLLTCLMRR